MCCWSKTNSVLSVSRRIILQRSRAVNTPRGPEGPAGRLQPRGVTSPHLFVVKSRFLSGRKKVADIHGSRSASAPRSRQLFLLFPGPALPKHVGRFQRVEITAWSSGACRRAGLAGWPAGRPAGLKSTSALFSEAHRLLIRPAEGSFLVFFSAVCNYSH